MVGRDLDMESWNCPRPASISLVLTLTLSVATFQLPGTKARSSPSRRVAARVRRCLGSHSLILDARDLPCSRPHPTLCTKLLPLQRIASLPRTALRCASRVPLRAFLSFLVCLGRTLCSGWAALGLDGAGQSNSPNVTWWPDVVEAMPDLQNLVPTLARSYSSFRALELLTPDCF